MNGYVVINQESGNVGVVGSLREAREQVYWLEKEGGPVVVYELGDEVEL